MDQEAGYGNLEVGATRVGAVEVGEDTRHDAPCLPAESAGKGKFPPGRERAIFSRISRVMFEQVIRTAFLSESFFIPAD